jgi:hypothetical protein
VLPYVLLACQLVVGGLFAMSAAAKARDAAAFRDSLESFGVRPERRRPVAAVVVASEVVVVPLVLAPPAAIAGFALGGLLLAGFAVAIARVVRAGLAVRCRCFGAEGAVLRVAHVWRNAALAGVAALGAVLAATRGDADPTGVGEVAVTGLFALAVLVLVSMFDDVVELIAPARARTR